MQRVVISFVARTRASNEAIVGSSNVIPMSPTRVHPTSQPIPPQCLPQRFLCLPKCLPQCLPQLLRHQLLHIIMSRIRHCTFLSILITTNHRHRYHHQNHQQVITHASCIHRQYIDKTSSMHRQCIINVSAMHHRYIVNTSSVLNPMQRI